MKHLRTTVCLALATVLVFTAVTAQAAGSTYIGPLLVSFLIPPTIGRLGSTTFSPSFFIQGAGRDNFNDAVWAIAYSLGRTKYTVNYKITVREDRQLWPDKQLLGPFVYTRIATIVAGDPRMPAPVWVKIQLEDGRTVVPGTVSEAQHLMFDVSQSYTISGTTLGVGDHRIFARLEANWSGYLLSGNDTKDKTAPRAILKVVN